MKFKRNLVFAFFLIAGVIVGGALASLTASIPFLSWLSYGRTIGISTADPLLLDLALVKIAFGFELGVNLAQIITITLALLTYKSVAAKL
ncbi:MAG: DUF4321 domain-containing protein [Oscillospiraceae bacterium]